MGTYPLIYFMRNKQFGYRYRKIRLQKEKIDKIVNIVLLTLVVLGIATFALFSRKADSEAIKSPVATVVAVKQPTTTNTAKVAPKPKTSPTKQSVGSVEARIRAIAKEMGYQAPNFLVRLARCESGLNNFAVGDKGTSFGLFQIHYPAQAGFTQVIHKNITKAQALDIDYSTRWTIKKLMNGGAGIWTCTKIIS